MSTYEKIINKGDIDPRLIFFRKIKNIQIKEPMPQGILDGQNIKTYLYSPKIYKLMNTLIFFFGQRTDFFLKYEPNFRTNINVSSIKGGGSGGSGGLIKKEHYPLKFTHVISGFEFEKRWLNVLLAFNFKTSLFNIRHLQVLIDQYSIFYVKFYFHKACLNYLTLKLNNKFLNFNDLISYLLQKKNNQFEINRENNLYIQGNNIFFSIDNIKYYLNINMQPKYKRGIKPLDYKFNLLTKYNKFSYYYLLYSFKYNEIDLDYKSIFFGELELNRKFGEKGGGDFKLADGRFYHGVDSYFHSESYETENIYAYKPIEYYSNFSKGNRLVRPSFLLDKLITDAGYNAISHVVDAFQHSIALDTDQLIELDEDDVLNDLDDTFLTMDKIFHTRELFLKKVNFETLNDLLFKSVKATNERIAKRREQGLREVAHNKAGSPLINFEHFKYAVLKFFHLVNGEKELYMPPVMNNIYGALEKEGFFKKAFMAPKGSNYSREPEAIYRRVDSEDDDEYSIYPMYMQDQMKHAYLGLKTYDRLGGRAGAIPFIRNWLSHGIHDGYYLSTVEQPRRHILHKTLFEFKNFDLGIPTPYFGKLYQRITDVDDYLTGFKHDIEQDAISNFYPETFLKEFSLSREDLERLQHSIYVVRQAPHLAASLYPGHNTDAAFYYSLGLRNMLIVPEKGTKAFGLYMPYGSASAGEHELDETGVGDSEEEEELDAVHELTEYPYFLQRFGDLFGIRNGAEIIYQHSYNNPEADLLYFPMDKNNKNIKTQIGFFSEIYHFDEEYTTNAYKAFFDKVEGADVLDYFSNFLVKKDMEQYYSGKKLDKEIKKRITRLESSSKAKEEGELERDFEKSLTDEKAEEYLRAEKGRKYRPGHEYSVRFHKMMNQDYNIFNVQKNIAKAIGTKYNYAHAFYNAINNQYPYLSDRRGIHTSLYLQDNNIQFFGNTGLNHSNSAFYEENEILEPKYDDCLMELTIRDFRSQAFLSYHYGYINSLEKFLKYLNTLDMKSLNERQFEYIKNQLTLILKKKRLYLQYFFNDYGRNGLEQELNEDEFDDILELEQDVGAQLSEIDSPDFETRLNFLNSEDKTLSNDLINQISELKVLSAFDEEEDHKVNSSFELLGAKVLNKWFNSNKFFNLGFGSNEQLKNFGTISIKKGKIKDVSYYFKPINEIYFNPNNTLDISGKSLLKNKDTNYFFIYNFFKNKYLYFSNFIRGFNENLLVYFFIKEDLSLLSKKSISSVFFNYLQYFNFTLPISTKITTYKPLISFGNRDTILDFEQQRLNLINEAAIDNKISAALLLNNSKPLDFVYNEFKDFVDTTLEKVHGKPLIESINIMYNTAKLKGESLYNDSFPYTKVQFLTKIKNLLDSGFNNKEVNPLALEFKQQIDEALLFQKKIELEFSIDAYFDKDLIGQQLDVTNGLRFANTKLQKNATFFNHDMYNVNFNNLFKFEKTLDQNLRFKSNFSSFVQNVSARPVNFTRLVNYGNSLPEDDFYLFNINFWFRYFYKNYIFTKTILKDGEKNLRYGFMTGSGVHKYYGIPLYGNKNKIYYLESNDNRDISFILKMKQYQKLKQKNLIFNFFINKNNFVAPDDLKFGEKDIQTTSLHEVHVSFSHVMPKLLLDQELKNRLEIERLLLSDNAYTYFLQRKQLIFDNFNQQGSWLTAFLNQIKINGEHFKEYADAKLADSYIISIYTIIALIKATFGTISYVIVYTLEQIVFFFYAMKGLYDISVYLIYNEVDLLHKLIKLLQLLITHINGFYIMPLYEAIKKTIINWYKIYFNFSKDMYNVEPLTTAGAFSTENGEDLFRYIKNKPLFYREVESNTSSKHDFPVFADLIRSNADCHYFIYPKQELELRYYTRGSTPVVENDYLYYKTLNYLNNSGSIMRRPQLDGLLWSSSFYKASYMFRKECQQTSFVSEFLLFNNDYIKTFFGYNTSNIYYDLTYLNDKVNFFYYGNQNLFGLFSSGKVPLHIGKGNRNSEMSFFDRGNINFVILGQKYIFIRDLFDEYSYYFRHFKRNTNPLVFYRYLYSLQLQGVQGPVNYMGYINDVDYNYPITKQEIFYGRDFFRHDSKGNFFINNKLLPFLFEQKGKKIKFEDITMYQKLITIGRIKNGLTAEKGYNVFKFYDKLVSKLVFSNGKVDTSKLKFLKENFEEANLRVIEIFSADEEAKAKTEKETVLSKEFLNKSIDIIKSELKNKNKLNDTTLFDRLLSTSIVKKANLDLSKNYYDNVLFAKDKKITTSLDADNNLILLKPLFSNLTDQYQFYNKQTNIWANYYVNIYKRGKGPKLSAKYFASLYFDINDFINKKNYYFFSDNEDIILKAETIVNDFYYKQFIYSLGKDHCMGPTIGFTGFLSMIQEYEESTEATLTFQLFERPLILLTVVKDIGLLLNNGGDFYGKSAERGRMHKLFNTLEWYFHFYNKETFKKATLDYFNQYFDFFRGYVYRTKIKSYSEYNKDLVYRPVDLLAIEVNKIPKYWFNQGEVQKGTRMPQYMLMEPEDNFAAYLVLFKLKKIIKRCGNMTPGFENFLLLYYKKYNTFYKDGIFNLFFERNAREYKYGVYRTNNDLLGHLFEKNNETDEALNKYILSVKRLYAPVEEYLRGGTDGFISGGFAFFVAPNDAEFAVDNVELDFVTITNEVDELVYNFKNDFDYFIDDDTLYGDSDDDEEIDYMSDEELDEFEDFPEYPAMYPMNAPELDIFNLPLNRHLQTVFLSEVIKEDEPEDASLSLFNSGMRPFIKRFYKKKMPLLYDKIFVKVLGPVIPFNVEINNFRLASGFYFKEAVKFIDLKLISHPNFRVFGFKVSLYKIYDFYSELKYYEFLHKYNYMKNLG